MSSPPEPPEGPAAALMLDFWPPEYSNIFQNRECISIVSSHQICDHLLKWPEGPRMDSWFMFLVARVNTGPQLLQHRFTLGEVEKRSWRGRRQQS